MPIIDLNPIRLRLITVRQVYLPFFFVAPRRCAKSEAATSFSFFVLLGLLRMRPASDAGFFPVAIIATPVAGDAEIKP